MEKMSTEQEISFCGHLALMLIKSWAVQEIADEQKIFMEDACIIYKKKSKLHQVENPSDETIKKAVVAAGTRSELVDDVVAKIKEMNWNIEQNRLELKKVTTCVYCGHEYPENTPSSGSPILTDHLHQCEKNPTKILKDALAFYARSLDADDAKSVIEAWYKDDFGSTARKAFEQLNIKYDGSETPQ